MPPLSDYKRVMHRSGLSSDDIEPSDIEEYIEDAQALIEGDTERTFAEGDTSYNLARAACTDLAAAYAMIRILGGKYSGLEFYEDELELGSQQTTKIQLVGKYLARVTHALAILKRGEAIVVVPKTTTPY